MTRDLKDPDSRSPEAQWLDASHDLLQPVRAAQLMLGALRDAATVERRAVIMDDLAAALASLDDMLGSMMASAEVDLGRLRPRVGDFVIGDAVDDVVRQAAALGRAKGVEVRGVRCRAMVRSDPVLARRMLGNLAVNAVRHSGSDRVLIGCRRRGDTIRVEVRDRGKGIAENDLARVFERFERGSPSAGPDGEGLGLGLAIVKGTADVLGHNIYVDSRAGGGSMFAITFPLSGIVRPDPGPSA